MEQNTLQAVFRLLSGELTHITLYEHCVRQDGSTGYFSVEINCLWKNNKAHCIVCFIRPAEEGQARQGGQGGNAAGVDGGNSAFQGAAGMNMGGLPNMMMPASPLLHCSSSSSCSTALPLAPLLFSFLLSYTDFPLLCGFLF